MHLPFAPRHLSPLIRALDRCLRASVRWEVRDPQDNVEAAAAGRPTIFVCRHGQLWPLLWAVRRARIGVMVSRSADGELLSRVLGEDHYRLLRGSKSREGGLAARLAIRELRAGRSIGLAVDGPRGPRGVVQEGVLRIAQRTEAGLVPMRVRGDGRWVLHATWDAFEIPRPGGRLDVEVGRRLFVGRGVDELDRARGELESALRDPAPQPVLARVQGGMA